MKGRKGWGVHKSIAPKKPSVATKARRRLGLAPIPKGLKPGVSPVVRNSG